MKKNIAILTSGGDSPGMNVVIKIITTNLLKNNINVYGIYNGYKGLYYNNIKLLKKKNVQNIFNTGGTFLKTSRFPELKSIKTRMKIIKNLKKNNISSLVVIGGEGSYLGAKKLIKMNFPCITIPGTIDNDIPGTDYTIGYYTALETIVSSIKKLKDTSQSHNRILILEVMGRKCGDLALASAISEECNFVISPETKFDEKKLIKNIKYKIKNKNKNIIIIITENICNIYKLSQNIEKKTKIETRATSLGYIQRGGIPVTFDKILATRISYYAINMILNNNLNKCIGIKNNVIINYNFIKNKNINNHFKTKWIENIFNKINHNK